MKKVLLAIGFVMLLCGPAMAQTFVPKGSAIVPGLVMRYGDVREKNLIVISNISGTDVTCKVTLFNHEHQDITNLCSVLTGVYSGNAQVEILTGTGTFDLPAGHTRAVNSPSSAISGATFGYAIIEWTSDDATLRKALVAGLRYHEYMTITPKMLMGGYVPINGGQPF